MNWLFTILCTLAILIMIPALSVLYREFTDARDRAASARLTTLICSISFVLWLLITVWIPAVFTSPLELPVAGLAAVSGFLSSLTVRDTTRRAPPALIFATLWTAIVFTPIAIVVLFPAAVGLGPTDGPLDLGGALPVHVAIGSGALVILTFARRWLVPDHSHIRPRSWTLLSSSLLLWIGWLFALIGLELGFDPVVTPRIITNAIVAPILAVLGWLVIQRIRTATTNAQSAFAGLLSGLVAITPGAAYFTPLWAGVTGAVAGIAAAVFVTGWSRATGRHAWFIVGGHLLAGMIGLLMLGLFGLDFGLIYDGQTALIQVQFLSTVAVMIWAGLVSLVLWPLVSWISRRTASPEAPMVTRGRHL